MTRKFFLRKFLERLGSLERAVGILDVATSKRGIGDNNPPEPIEAIALNETKRQSIANAIAKLIAQAAQQPNDEALPAATQLKATKEALGARLAAYAAKEGDAFLTGAVEAAGSTVGTVFATTVLSATVLITVLKIYHELVRAVEAVADG